MYYDPDSTRPNHYTSNPRWIYNLTTSQWINFGVGGTAEVPVPPVTPDSVLVNNGNTSNLQAGTPIPFTFTYHDPANGEADIASSYVSLQNSSGNCNVTWFRSSGLSGLSGNCGASVGSLVTSPGGDLTAIAVTINFTLNAGGNWSVQTYVTDANALSSPMSQPGQLGSVYLNMPNSPTITTSSQLPNGTVGVGYTQTLSATGGTPPYTWSITSGAPPQNLSLAANTGTLSGMPTPAGIFSFVVQVKDQNNSIASAPFALTVAPAITGLSLSSGPPQMGLVIYGAGFGATQGTSSVAVGGTPMPVVPGAWSDTSVTVQVPATGTGNIGVTVSTVGSGPFPFSVAAAFGCGQ